MIIQRLKHPVALRVLLQAVPDHFQAAACCPGYRHTISSSSNRASSLMVHADRKWILNSLPCLSIQHTGAVRSTIVKSQTCSTHVLCGHASGTCLHRRDRQTLPQTAVVGLTESPRGQVSSLHRQTERQTRSLPLPQAFVASAPLAWQPYMKLVRWDRPIGSYLGQMSCIIILHTYNPTYTCMHHTGTSHTYTHNIHCISYTCSAITHTQSNKQRQ